MGSESMLSAERVMEVEAVHTRRGTVADWSKHVARMVASPPVVSVAVVLITSQLATSSKLLDDEQVLSEVIKSTIPVPRRTPNNATAVLMVIPVSGAVLSRLPWPVVV